MDYICEGNFKITDMRNVFKDYNLVNIVEGIINKHFEDLNNYDLYNAFCYLKKYRPSSRILKRITEKYNDIAVYDVIYGYEYVGDLDFENQMMLLNAQNLE